VYESSFFGTVPIAVEGVETASWLGRKNIGVILGGDAKMSLQSFLGALTGRRYETLFKCLEAVPTSELADTRESCEQLLRALEKPDSPTVRA